MSNTKKGAKTTVVAISQLVLGLSLLVMWYLGKVDNAGVAVGITAITWIGSIIGNYFAKDSDQTHSISMGASGDLDTSGGHPDPNKEEK